jgi:drug/metabolite transporter (DMT)-like permease
LRRTAARGAGEPPRGLAPLSDASGRIGTGWGGAGEAQTLRATLIGAVAVVLWSSLPTLSTLAGNVPPFQLMGMAFAIAFAVAFGRWSIAPGGVRRRFAHPPRAWLIGLYGLFGYHFCYFVAIQHAPPAAASLVNYLWPLLIVVFSSLLPGERLRWWHVLGTLLGLAGVVLLVTDGGRVVFQAQFATGYAFAAACALIWSTYSVLNRVFAREVSSDAVGAFCGATAALAGLCHLAFEPTRWPSSWQWAAVALLGLGPLGAAFFVWDHGCKHGDIRVLGALAYLTPLLATALLVATGLAPASWVLVVACLLIAGGAVLASREMLVRRRRGAKPAIR